MSHPFGRLSDLPEFTVTSEDVTPGEKLNAPQRSGIMNAGGSDTSPQLSWSGFPEDTKSFAVTVFDEDAPSPSGFWHWYLLDIPADVTSIEAGIGSVDSAALPAGAWQAANDALFPGYLGAAPPPGRKHRYHVTVHALSSEKLDVPPNASGGIIGCTLFFNSIGRANIESWTDTPA